MDKVPPRLLYLVIYNPSLRPPEDSHPDQDDEDAEERAHVLFYTADNHAVSKDKVLRQVGLAKALANFTTIFGPQVVCDSVHSQTRKMVMLSPEPNFWINASFELERVPRISRKDEKGKGKQKEPSYDHNEASLHDAALHAQLLLGYEAFKVTHGTFTSILNDLGREGLEIQLERFFTVWAWSWDLSKPISFPDYLGIRIHPLSNQVTSLVDILEDKLPPHYFPLVLISSCIVTSKSTPLRCPPALIRYLLRILENRSALRQQTTTPGKDTNDDSSSQAPELSTEPEVNNRTHSRTPSKAFLGVPGINMNVNMDVRKWNWPGYLTFGIKGSPSGSKSQNTPAETEDGKTHGQSGGQDQSLDMSDTLQAQPETPVDAQALEDALSSEATSQVAEAPEGSSSVAAESPPEDVKNATAQNVDSTGLEPSINHTSSIPARDDEPLEAMPAVNDSMPDVDQAAPQVFSEIYLHLSVSNPLDTHRRLVRYLCRGNILLALVPSPEKVDDTLDEVTCQDLSERCAELMDRLKEIVEVEQEKITSAFSSSPVQSVLQKSQHVIATSDQLTSTSSSFTTTSWHLHEGRKLLLLDSDLHEIYSRGQSPQDWHLAKRMPGPGIRGEVYMEIGRKEASLVDVDSEITGVLRRFTECN
ncbi:uncharacterized protein FOMMEDRAFT_143994 [Fomitiporia mediterranea MF3/22]|uniref:uncharacterized protein n=1 Tax=Fomitiporia mediterranea (strain MF3/22) TaxID=694068 RepID=UPI0004408500|nr:uncharacterized protein FOMMEDRAFT_143994 [Fomitiporia mediterranea MF3/22]EJD07702.1 hypothetical protein FOMMEDRAFT_143994 [Fomitiporia mediterranea MF3/22]